VLGIDDQYDLQSWNAIPYHRVPVVVLFALFEFIQDVPPPMEFIDGEESEDGTADVFEGDDEMWDFDDESVPEVEGEAIEDEDEDDIQWAENMLDQIEADDQAAQMAQFEEADEADMNDLVDWFDNQEEEEDVSNSDDGSTDDEMFTQLD